MEYGQISSLLSISFRTFEETFDAGFACGQRLCDRIEESGGVVVLCGGDKVEATIINGMEDLDLLLRDLTNIVEKEGRVRECRCNQTRLVIEEW